MNVTDTASVVSSGTAERTDASSRDATRSQLAALAAEFESMLLMTVLRDMRTSGKWAADESGMDTLGADTFDRTFDVELSRFLSQAGGLGLSQQLLKAFESIVPSAEAPASDTGCPVPDTGCPVRDTGCPVPDTGCRVQIDLATPGVPRATPGVGYGTPGVEPGAAAALRAQAAYITSGFGWRQDPLNGDMRFHRGIDVRAAEGDQVSSTGDGRVIFSGADGGYGTSVLVEHPNGLRTRYAHLSAALVGVGDVVGAGQAIGLAGRTGRATAPHLHYEVLTADGRAVDPQGK